MAQTRCFAVDLKDDPQLIAEYEKYHQPENAWPEIVESIAGAGISNMRIFRIENRLFMIMDVDESFDASVKAKADAENVKVQEWETLMDTFQQRLPWAKNGEKWLELSEIYNLQETQSAISEGS